LISKDNILFCFSFEKIKQKIALIFLDCLNEKNKLDFT